MKWLLKSSFYKKIQISLFLFILLPLALASFFSYFLIKDIVVDKVENSRQNVVDVIASDLNKNIEDIIYASNLFGNPHSNTFSDLRAFKDVDRITSFEKYQIYLRISESLNLAFSKTTGLNAQVFYLNNNNLVVYGTNNTLSHSSFSKVVDPQWISTLRPNRLYWVEATNSEVPSLSKKESYYFLVKVFKDFATMENIGTIFVGIPHEYFKGLFVNADKGEFLLYSNDGHLIYQYPEFTSKFDKDQGVVVTSTVSHTDWKIVYRSSYNNITGEISRLFRFYAIFIAISIFVFLVISIFISRSIYSPLNRLRTTAEQVGKENLNVRFQVKGNDEFTILGNAFNDMLDQINLLFRKVKQKQEEKRLIELEALFAQIRPHFLINTLNSIKCNLILDGDSLHSEKINNLMRLLRAYMNANELVPISQECNLLVDYTEIMKMRNEMNLELIVNLPLELEDFRVPRLILQPIVENAIIHGFEEEIIDPTIYVNVREMNQWIEVEINDNGIGMSSEKIKSITTEFDNKDEYDNSNKHVGLKNVLQRLKLTYGTQASMKIVKNEKSGISITLYIPKPE